MPRALLIYNPAAGGRRHADRRAQRLARCLEAAGLDVSVARTESPGHAEFLARDSACAVDVVFSYGGDGTLRECAAGLLGSETPLGFLPGGTANVMARIAGVPQDPLRAARLLAGGSSVPLDVGLCDGRPLLMQASAGLDAEILGRVDARRKRLLGKAEVALSALPAWWSYDYPAFDVRWDGNQRRASFVAICNIAFYGGPVRLAPRARCDDRALDLVIFSGSGRRATMAFARDLLLGRHGRRSDVEIVRVESVEVGSSRGLALQIDGDRIDDALPTRVRLSTDRIRFLVAHQAAADRAPI